MRRDGLKDESKCRIIPVKSATSGEVVAFAQNRPETP